MRKGSSQRGCFFERKLKGSDGSGSTQRCMGGPHNILSGQSRFSLSSLNRFALIPQIDCTARLLKDEAVPAKHDGRSA